MRCGNLLTAAVLGRAALVLALLAAAMDHAVAGSDLAEMLKPDRVFAQGGSGEGTRAFVAGLRYDWGWQRPLGGGVVTGNWEGSFGRWNSDLPNGTNASAWVTQLGVTPVLRWHASRAPDAWFVEGGIGANVLIPVYRSSDKRFSTAFNFGDHLAVGRALDAQGHHELSLRVQHFSNGGIKHPNPGENFLQLRYSWHWGE